MRRTLTKSEKIQQRRSSLMGGDSVDDMTSQKEGPCRQTFRGRASERTSSAAAHGASGASASSAGSSSQEPETDDSLSEMTAQRI